MSAVRVIDSADLHRAAALQAADIAAGEMGLLIGEIYISKACAKACSANGRTTFSARHFRSQ